MDPSPGKTELSPSAAPAKPTGPLGEEVDVWIGSYSGLAMTPSLLVCFVLTSLIAWAAWMGLLGERKGFLQLTVILLVGAVWSVQTIRWCYRIFGLNYRLTTKRLFRDRGFGYQGRGEVKLHTIAEVQVRQAFHEKMVSVGRLVISFHEPGQIPLILQGVLQPKEIATLILKYAQKARTQGQQ